MNCFKCKEIIYKVNEYDFRYVCYKCKLNIWYHGKITSVCFNINYNNGDCDYDYYFTINGNKILLIDKNKNLVYSEDIKYFESLEYYEAGKYILKLIDNIIFV